MSVRKALVVWMSLYSRNRAGAVRLIAGLTCVLLLSWLAPGQAVDIVRKSSRRLRADPSAAQNPKEQAPADTASESVRLLLDDVRLQKDSAKRGDTLDTWIDRDGDGVNDRLKKTVAPEGVRMKGFQPSGGTKETKPSTSPQPTKKTKSSSGESSTKKRRR